SPIRPAIRARKTVPATTSRRCSLRVSWMMLTSIALPRDPHGGGGAPDREAEEEVSDHGGQDRGPDRSARRGPDACRAARGGIAVVAVDQDDGDGQDDQLQERPEHVD